MSETNLSSKPRWNHAFQRLWILHWVMAGCFLIIYGVGIVMTRLPREFVFRGSLYNTHKSFGVLVLCLLLIRVFVLLQAFSKKYLKRSPRVNRRWIQVTLLHVVLYLFMLAIPISGIWLSNVGGYPVSLFFIPLPNWFAKNHSMGAIAKDLHFWLSYLLLICLGLHIVQQWQFVENIWRRIKS